MYMRRRAARPPHGRADELTRHWAASLAGQLNTLPQAFATATSGLIGTPERSPPCTVFEKEPDGALLEGLAGEFQALVREIGESGVGQPPETTTCAIVAEASSPG